MITTTSTQHDIGGTDPVYFDFAINSDGATTFGKYRPQRLIHSVEFYLEDYSPMTRETYRLESQVFRRGPGEYIDNDLIIRIYEELVELGSPPANEAEQTRIVMREKSTRLDVTSAFLRLKACVDDGYDIQMGMPAFLFGEDIDLADALHASARPQL